VVTGNILAVTAQDGITKAIYTITVDTSELTTAKATAHSALATAFASYHSADYTAGNWKSLKGFKNDGDKQLM